MFDAARIEHVAKMLKDAHRRMPVLKVIGWPSHVRERFFEMGEAEPPRVVYRPWDPSPVLADLNEARAMCPRSGVVGPWLRRVGLNLVWTARMLGAVGTPAFTTLSQKLYGRPTDPFPHTPHSPLDLARRLIRTAERVAMSFPEPPPPTLDASDVAEEIRIAVKAHFGVRAPVVEVVPVLSARASAVPAKIRLRAGARFSDLDVRQLIEHEAYVHVATALNGKRQRAVPILSANHAGTTCTQEGLAVFAEMISGALDPHRFLRLAHRVVAIQRALDGGDFLDVYRYFLEHSGDRIEAYESASRIFRGGLVEGGVPFTKDMVYLDGLCRVHVFMRAGIDTGRIDCMRMLFAGKLDVADIPAVMELHGMGLCKEPRFVPPWVSDPRRLVAYFAVTDVIGRASTAGLRDHYVRELRALPRRVPWGSRAVP
jgi:uncharacterized protein (TIGR02421 family)